MLRINEPDDSFEQEADRLAEEVATGRRAQWSLSSIGVGAPLQRKCACGGNPGPAGECEACRKKRLQRKGSDPSSVNRHPSEVPPIVHEVLRSPGQPLDAKTRAFMEPRFGHDFGHVRVHTDAKAAESARAVHALAYTVGHNVVFDAAHSPETIGSRRLLGHELAHVVQQSAGGVSPDRRSERDAAAAATDLDRGRPVRVAMGTRVGLARQSSSSTDDSDLYQAFIDTPQIEKDRVLSRFRAAAPQPKTTPVEDTGCHTDPNKKSPGQAKCAVSHHKTAGNAEQAVAAAMQHPLDVSQFEKEQRGKLDRLNEAFLYYKATGKYIRRDEFSPYEIEKDNIIATSDRWDAWMNGRGVGVNNLEAAEFDRRFFRSKAEFDLELRRRDKEYAARLATCRKEGKGPKWPKASRTRPEYLDCEERVAAEYEPTKAAAQDASRAWAHGQLSTLERIETAGPVSTAGLFVGGVARVMRGGESIEAAPSALALGSLGDALALAPGAPPLAGTAQDPGQAPGALVEKAPPREDMPAPGPMQPLVQPTEPTPATTARTSAGSTAGPVVDPASRPMRQPPGRGTRGTYSATEKTGTQHKQSTPKVEVARPGAVPMKDFEPPQPGHYIVRKPPAAETQAQILARAGRTTDGRLRDANTGRALNDGEAVWGHSPWYQFKEMRDMAEKLGWTQEEFDRFFDDPAKWQVEYGPTNSSRVFDRIPRQRPVH
ncbi:MAG TPA: DUF4157 domain-containing protein [Bryobacteraceae bacterium]|jgi:hypothetical protein|nr:DUF4157 domain-containing protein [Bryobacteraceae bacterium]